MKFKIALFILILLLSVGTTIAQPGPITITGSSVPGNLKVKGYEFGAIDIMQVDGTMAFAPRLDSDGGKGSFIYTTQGTCGLGYISTTGAVPQQNTLLNSSTISTDIDCTAIFAGFNQKIKYVDGQSIIQYTWTITNNGSSALTDLRFFHAQDSEYGTFEPQTQGFFDSSNSIIGAAAVQTSPGDVSLSIATRADSPPPSAYDSRNPDSIVQDILASSGPPSLANLIQSGSNGHALQWNLTSLAPGASFVITATERYSVTSTSLGVVVLSPITTSITAGQSASAIFGVIHAGFSPINLTGASASITQAGWSASVTGAPNFPVSINPGQLILITTNVQSSPNATLNQTVPLMLHVTNANGSSSDDTLVQVTALPPPTFTPTPTVTPTPSIPLAVIQPKRGSGSLTPLIRGTSPANASIQIVIDGVVVATTTAKPDGSWSITIPTAISAGKHTLDVAAQVGTSTPISLNSPVTFVATGGAVLDFDGDGITDVTNYSSVGNTVNFRMKRSSDDVNRNVAIIGRVPAPGDYDADGTWDFAAIRRSGNDLIWRVQMSGSGQFQEQTFGGVGEKPLTGCRFNTARQYSIATIDKKNKISTTDFGSSATTVNSPILTSGEIIGCFDSDGDGRDELITSESLSSGKVRLKLKKIDGSSVENSMDVNAFDRGYVLYDQENHPLLGVVRLVSSSERRGSVIGLTGEFSTTIKLPRKLIVSGGILLDSSAKGFSSQVLWQNLKDNQINKQELAEGSQASIIGKIAKLSSLVQTQYIYKTTR